MSSNIKDSTIPFVLVVSDAHGTRSLSFKVYNNGEPAYGNSQFDPLTWEEDRTLFQRSGRNALGICLLTDPLQKQYNAVMTELAKTSDETGFDIALRYHLADILRLAAHKNQKLSDDQLSGSVRRIHREKLNAGLRP